MYSHNQLPIVLIFLACFGTLNAVQLACSSDADCSNGQGICTLTGNTSYCSCLSGFGGEDCSIRPDSACAGSFGNVSDTNQTLQADSTLQYLYPNLTLTVIANLEQSEFAFPYLNDTTLNSVPYSEELTIIFGNGSFPECDFPTNNVNWIDLSATSGNCNDEYTLSLAFTDAKALCGFADTDGNRIFEQVIHINRKYELETLRGESITRTDSVVKTLRVIFPQSVGVSTSTVQVVGSPSVLAAISLIDFDPASTPEKWTVETTTSIQSPFKLFNPTVISTSGTIQTNNRFENSSESISVVSGCGNDTQDCFQLVSLDFVAGSAPDACYGLTGSVTVQLNVTCSEGAGSDCPLEGGETVEIILNLATSDACPVTEQITFSTTTLTSYSDAGVTKAQTSFITNQIAYFGAVVESANGQIVGRSIQNGSVCFQIGSDACQPVTYVIQTSTNGNDPIFSVDFSDPANSEVFGSLNAADASSQLFSVHATIQVDFNGASKKSNHKRFGDGNQQVSLSTSVKVLPNASGNSAAGVFVPNLFLLLAFVSLQMML